MQLSMDRVKAIGGIYTIIVIVEGEGVRKMHKGINQSRTHQVTKYNGRYYWVMWSQGDEVVNKTENMKITKIIKIPSTKCYAIYRSSQNKTK